MLWLIYSSRKTEKIYIFGYTGSVKVSVHLKLLSVCYFLNMCMYRLLSLNYIYITLLLMRKCFVPGKSPLRAVMTLSGKFEIENTAIC